MPQAGFNSTWASLRVFQECDSTFPKLQPDQLPISISGGPSPDNLTPIGTLEGTTTDKEWIELAKPATNVRYIKIETVKSPSWVSSRLKS